MATLSWVAPSVKKRLSSFCLSVNGRAKAIPCTPLGVCVCREEGDKKILLLLLIFLLLIFFSKKETSL